MTILNFDEKKVWPYVDILNIYPRVHGRLLENSFTENQIFSRKLFYKKMFQGPKGYIAQICKVHLQYGNSTTKWPFYTSFLVNSPQIYILFSLHFIFDIWNLFSIANDCSVNPSDLRKMLVKKQMKYFDVLLDHDWKVLVLQEQIIYMLKDSMIT